MKATMLTFMLSLMLPMSSTVDTVPLSMMDQSVDDMYSGCTNKMDQKVQGVYFPREMKNNFFQNAWNQSESCAQDKYNNRTDKALTKDHLQAICVYTEDDPNVYEPFNTAVRNSSANYSTSSFQYHALHFWLTSAIQILNVNKPWRVTYRRSDIIFTGNVNQEIRFGQFTSTSKRPDLLFFGTETCFHINATLGAYIKGYSVFDKVEREVLIPPYEKFKITKIEKGSYQNLTNCKTIFVLESAGYLSKLNCKAALNNNALVLHSAFLGTQSHFTFWCIIHSFISHTGWW